MAFVPQKPLRCWQLSDAFLFRQPVWYSLPLCRHDSVSTHGHKGGHCTAVFTADLLKGENSMNWWMVSIHNDNQCNIPSTSFHQTVHQKEGNESRCASFLFSSAQSFCWGFDEDISCCYSLCLYTLSSIHQNNKCSSCNLPCRIPADLQTSPKVLNCWGAEITH